MSTSILSKLTPEQIEQSWKNLTSPSRAVVKKDKNHNEILKLDIQTLSKSEKDENLLLVLENGFASQFEELLKAGGEIDLALILQDCLGAPSKWEFAKLAHQYGQKCQNQNQILKLWEDTLNGLCFINAKDMIERLYVLDVKLPPQIIQKAWKNPTSRNLAMCLNSSYDFFPANWDKYYQKKLEHCLDGEIFDFIDACSEGSHSNLEDSKELIKAIEVQTTKNPQFDPLKEYRGGKKGLQVWSSLFNELESHLTTEMIKEILSLKITPPLRNSDDKSGPGKSWAWRAATVGSNEVFHFLIKSPIHQKLCEEDASNWEYNSSASKYNENFFALLLPILDKVGFDFSTKSAKDNYFYRLLYSWSFVYKENQISKKEEELLFKNYAQILNPPTPRSKSVADHIEKNWGLNLRIDTESYGVLNWNDLKGLLDKEKLKETLPKADALSNKPNKLRI